MSKHSPSKTGPQRSTQIGGSNPTPLSIKMSAVNSARMNEAAMKEDHAGIVQFFGHLFETATEKITAAIAGAAMLMPVWNPSLKDTSEFAALIAPIIGVVWLLLQIGIKLWELSRRPK